MQQINRTTDKIGHKNSSSTSVPCLADSLQALEIFDRSETRVGLNIATNEKLLEIKLASALDFFWYTKHRVLFLLNPGFQNFNFVKVEHAELNFVFEVETGEFFVVGGAK